MGVWHLPLMARHDLHFLVTQQCGRVPRDLLPTEQSRRRRCCREDALESTCPVSAGCLVNVAVARRERQPAVTCSVEWRLTRAPWIGEGGSHRAGSTARRQYPGRRAS